MLSWVMELERSIGTVTTTVPFMRVCNLFVVIHYVLRELVRLEFHCDFILICPMS